MRRKRKLVYGRKRAEVVKRLRELARQRDEGALVEGRSLKLRDFMKQWLESVGSSLRPSTFRTYRICVQHHLIPELGHVNVEKLTAAQVQAMLARELTRGMSSQTVVHLRAILRRAMTRALRFGMVSRNVVALTDPPEVEKDDPRVLDVVQAEAFLEAARNDRLRGLLLWRF